MPKEVYLLWGNQHRGERFGRLVVAGPSNSPAKHRKVFVRCDCGSTKTVRSDHLTTGRIVSCGCYRLERITKHGMAGSRVYNLWHAIIQRTRNPKATGFDHYGGRGIDIDPRWLASFDAFYADVGDPPTPRHQIDRKDNNRGYWPDNVRWATHQQNQWNQGKKSTLAQTSSLKGVSHVGRKWRATIRTDDGVRHLGYFHTEAEAGTAYAQAARALRGEFVNE